MSIQTVSHRAMSIENLSQDQIELLKRTVAKKCTNDELQLFLHVCKRTGLDPFAKQIYAIKRGDTMTFQTSIDGFRLIADRTGCYAPGQRATYTYDDNGKLASAISYIKKKTPDGTWHEVSNEAHFDEYNPSQGLWNKMPKIMLAKCAEALALRKAFPADLSGVYAKEEMDQADDETLEAISMVKESLPAIKESLITAEQAEEIEKTISVDEEYRQTLYTFFKIKHFSELQAKKIGAVWNALNKRYQKEEVGEIL